MGNLIIEALPAKTTATTSSSSLLPLLFLVLVVLIIYTMFSRRNRARQTAQMQSNLVPGTPVRTTSGIYGTIMSAEGADDVMVEISPGVSIRVMRRAIVQIPQDVSATNGAQPPPEPAPEDSPAKDSSAEELDSQDRNV